MCSRPSPHWASCSSASSHGGWVIWGRSRPRSPACSFWSPSVLRCFEYGAAIATSSPASSFWPCCSACLARRFTTMRIWSRSSPSPAEPPRRSPTGSRLADEGLTRIDAARRHRTVRSTVLASVHVAGRLRPGPRDREPLRPWRHRRASGRTADPRSRRAGRRANATIGRAVRLVCVNLGGARPGVVSMSTLAHPGRYTYCIGEHEEASPWESLAVEHGFAPEQSTVALLAADAPLGVYAQRSRTPEDLLPTLAASMAVISHHKMTHWGDTLVVLSPEHAKILGDAGWKKADVRRWLHERLQWPVCELVPGHNGGEGLPEHVLAKFAHPAAERAMIPKFRSPENIKLVVASGTAGRFSAIVPGWTFSKGSNLVFRRVLR